MNTPSYTDAPAESGHGTIRSYTIGFVLSIGLTLIAYFTVVNQALSGDLLVAVLIGLALIQLAVQLLFFLHLGRESQPRWNLIVFSFAVLIVAVVVFGSLWIMHNLDARMMMTPQQMNSYMINQAE